MGNRAPRKLNAAAIMQCADIAISSTPTSLSSWPVRAGGARNPRRPSPTTGPGPGW
jgi:hypothetical protein